MTTNYDYYEDFLFSLLLVFTFAFSFYISLFIYSAELFIFTNTSVTPICFFGFWFLKRKNFRNSFLLKKAIGAEWKGN